MSVVQIPRLAEWFYPGPLSEAINIYCSKGWLTLIFKLYASFDNKCKFRSSPLPDIQSHSGSVQVYIEDSLGERIWVDSCHCKTFVDNIQTAFATRMPPKSMLLQADAGRSAGDLSAGTGSQSPSSANCDVSGEAGALTAT